MNPEKLFTVSITEEGNVLINLSSNLEMACNVDDLLTKDDVAVISTVVSNMANKFATLILTGGSK